MGSISLDMSFQQTYYTSMISLERRNQSSLLNWGRDANSLFPIFNHQLKILKLCRRRTKQRTLGCCWTYWVDSPRRRNHHKCSHSWGRGMPSHPRCSRSRGRGMPSHPRRSRSRGRGMRATPSAATPEGEACQPPERDGNSSTRTWPFVPEDFKTCSIPALKAAAEAMKVLKRWKLGLQNTKEKSRASQDTRSRRRNRKSNNRSKRSNKNRDITLKSNKFWIF